MSGECDDCGNTMCVCSQVEWCHLCYDRAAVTQDGVCSVCEEKYPRKPRITERDYFQREIHALETSRDEAIALLESTLRSRRPQKKTIRHALRVLQGSAT